LAPFCGSGTLPIEAALIGRNMAPGLKRSFAAEQWPRLSSKMWQRVREEAEAAIDWERPLEIMGTDIDGAILKAARQNAQRAGVFAAIHFQQMPVNEVRTSRQYGVMITNPPYGERLRDRPAVAKLYKELAATIKPLDSWSFYILTAFPEFERTFGRIADRKRKLYNGDLLCYYYQYYGPRPPR
ncbi:MAG: class I SAM-dependent RNA methyltransferase, partial [Firmicutes bacterium]|nr:class I SAM-dependent RNA methyltransferase [Bacillota bacterium]